jgi:hypothetical protein
VPKDIEQRFVKANVGSYGYGSKVPRRAIYPTLKTPHIAIEGSKLSTEFSAEFSGMVNHLKMEDRRPHRATIKKSKTREIEFLSLDLGADNQIWPLGPSKLVIYKSDRKSRQKSCTPSTKYPSCSVRFPLEKIGKREIATNSTPYR